LGDRRDNEKCQLGERIFSGSSLDKQVRCANNWVRLGFGLYKMCDSDVLNCTTYLILSFNFFFSVLNFGTTT